MTLERGEDSALRARQFGGLLAGGWPLLIVAGLWTAPVVVAPIIVTGCIFWSKAEFAARYPDQLLHAPVTVSTAQSDPFIAAVSVQWIALAAFLLAIAVWRIVLQLRARIHSLFARRVDRRRQWALCSVYAVALLQMVALAGMILQSRFPVIGYDVLHMAGSYMLFVGHATSISISGLLCAALYRAGRSQHRSPSQTLQAVSSRLEAARAPMAYLVGFLSICFGASFLLKDLSLPVDWFTLQVVYTRLEILVLISFLLYCASFAPCVFRNECHRLSS